MALKNAIAVLISMGVVAAATATPALHDVDKTPLLAEQKHSEATVSTGTPLLLLAESQQSPVVFSEKVFAQKASSGGLAEVKIGELAQDHSENETVRRFAIEVANDYENAYEKLHAAADEMGIAMAKEMTAEQNQQYAELAKLTGSAFDQAYIVAKVKDYEDTVQLYRLEARKGDASALQLFAAYIVPKLEQHLAAAKDIQEALKNVDSSK